MGNWITYWLVKNRNIKGIKKYLNKPIIISTRVLTESLKKQDGIFEYLCQNHYYDIRRIHEIPIDSIPLVVRELDNLYELYGFIHCQIDHDNRSVLDYVLSKRKNLLGGGDWTSFLNNENCNIEIISLLLKHIPKDIINSTLCSILHSYQGDERIDQVIRFIYHDYYLSVYIPSIRRLLEDQENRKSIAKEVCLRKNIPVEVESNIIEFLKY